MSTVDPNTRRIPREMLIRDEATYRVYIDADTGALECDIHEGEVSVPCEVLLARARVSATAPNPYLTPRYTLAWKRMLGEAMGLAIAGDVPHAEQLLAEANDFLAARARETARMWYAQATIGLLVGLLSLQFAVANFFPVPRHGDSLTKAELKNAKAADDSGSNPPTDAGGSPPADAGSNPPTEAGSNPPTEAQLKEDTAYSARLFLMAVIAGATGAAFSLLVRVGTLDIDPSSGRWSHYGEVVFRLTIGALAALILVIGVKANLLSGFLNVSSPEDGLITAANYSKDYWILAMIAIAAGASERMVPGLLQHLSDRGLSEQSSSPPAPTATPPPAAAPPAAE